MTQDRLLTSLNWRPMVGSAVATMVWSSAARNIVSNRLIRMVRTSSGVSGAGGAIGGASLTSMTSVVMRESSRPISSGNVVWSAGSRPCRWCLFMSDVIFFCAAKAAEMESPYRQYNRGRVPFAAAPRAHGCIPRGCLRVPVMDQRNSFRGIRSGFRPLLQPRPLRQQGRPLHDVVLEILIGDLVLGALHPAADGNPGFMHGIGITRNQRMPPVEIASLRDQLVTAARRQPVQGADVLGRQADTIRNLVGTVPVVLAGAQA